MISDAQLAMSQIFAQRSCNCSTLYNTAIESSLTSRPMRISLPQSSNRSFRSSLPAVWSVPSSKKSSHRILSSLHANRALCSMHREHRLLYSTSTILYTHVYATRNSSALFPLIQLGCNHASAAGISVKFNEISYTPPTTLTTHFHRRGINSGKVIKSILARYSLRSCGLEMRARASNHIIYKYKLFFFRGKRC